MAAKVSMAQTTQARDSLSSDSSTTSAIWADLGAGVRHLLVLLASFQQMAADSENRVSDQQFSGETRTGCRMKGGHDRKHETAARTSGLRRQAP